METSKFLGLAHWLKRSLSDQNVAIYADDLLKHLADHPLDADAMMDLSIVLQMSSQVDLGLKLQQQALQLQQVYTLSKPLASEPTRVLALMMPGPLMQNTPIECLLDSINDIELSLLYVGDEVPIPNALPAHDVLFVAVGESDRSQTLLHSLSDILSDWHVPVINSPAGVARMARDQVASALQHLPGLVMPINQRLSKKELHQIVSDPTRLPMYVADGRFPLIIRPIDSHAGIGLERVDDASALATYLNTQASTEVFFVARFIDYRNETGMFCKYRVALINGQAFVCHVAMSTDWMIHYANAGMRDDVRKRDLEASLMASFDASFAIKHAEALKKLNESFGLDYLGIDCAELPNGDLLIFEVDTSMVVHAFDNVEIYPYKQAHMHRLFLAFRDFILSKSS